MCNNYVIHRSYSTGVYLSLKGVNYYTNNSVIYITDIDRTNILHQVSDTASNNGLQCVTGRRPCCGITGRSGEWFFPDGEMVPVEGHATTFYRNRGDDGTVNLNRHNSDVIMPTGRFCCVLFDASSTEVTQCALIGMNK